MTNEELQEVIALADFRLDKMKDDIHDLFDENKQLKKKYENAVADYELEKYKNNKAIEWVHEHISKYNCKGITIIDWDNLSNPNDLLEILGDKENE